MKHTSSMQNSCVKHLLRNHASATTIFEVPATIQVYMNQNPNQWQDLLLNQHPQCGITVASDEEQKQEPLPIFQNFVGTLGILKPMLTRHYTRLFELGLEPNALLATVDALGAGTS